MLGTCTMEPGRRFVPVRSRWGSTFYLLPLRLELAISCRPEGQDRTKLLRLGSREVGFTSVMRLRRR